MISSASSQIEATGGDHMKTTIVQDGKRTVVPDYARVQGILIGTVAAYILFLVIVGPECVPPHGIHHFDLILTDERYRNHGSNFEQQGTAFSENTSNDAPPNQRGIDDEKLSETRSEEMKEKV